MESEGAEMEGGQRRGEREGSKEGKCGAALTGAAAAPDPRRGMRLWIFLCASGAFVLTTMFIH
jgi:hypothetical protein